MTLKSKLLFGLAFVLFYGCKENRADLPEKSIPERLNPSQEMVTSLDGKSYGTAQTIRDSLERIIFSKSKIITGEEKDFMCDCFIKEIRQSNDHQMILPESLDKCNTLLRKRREKGHPGEYIYSTDGELIGTKTSIKMMIQTEMKQKKVNGISEKKLNYISDCISGKFTKMTSKQIDNKSSDLFLECLMDSYSE